MRFIAGIICLSVAAALLAAGLAHRRRVLAARAGLPEETIAPQSLAAFGEIMRPIMLGLLVYLGLKTALVYAAFDGGAVFSLFDLAGFLGLLAAYGAWLTLRTKHRMPVAPLAAATREERSGNGPVPATGRDDPGLRRDLRPGALSSVVRAPRDRPGPRIRVAR